MTRDEWERHASEYAERARMRLMEARQFTERGWDIAAMRSLASAFGHLREADYHLRKADEAEGVQGG